LHPVQIASIDENSTQVIIAAKQATITGISPDLAAKLFRSEGFSLLDLADWSPTLDLEADVIPLLTRLVKQGLLFVKSPEDSPTAAAP
jgi:hypothetical protein